MTSFLCLVTGSFFTGNLKKKEPGKIKSHRQLFPPICILVNPTGLAEFPKKYKK